MGDDLILKLTGNRNASCQSAKQIQSSTSKWSKGVEMEGTDNKVETSTKWFYSLKVLVR